MNLKFFILFSFYALGSYSQESVKISELDSVKYYINKSKAKSTKSNDRLKYAFRAKVLSQKHQSDSLLVKSYLNLASLYSDKDYKIRHDEALFVKYSHYALSLSKRINNLPLIALSNESLGYYYFDKSVDSAYYYNNKAEKLYSGLKDNFNRVVVLYDIAILQRSDKDYTGSELTCVNALSLLDGLSQTDNVIEYKSYFYSVLALNFRNLELHKKSVEYHKKAFELSKKVFGNSDKALNPIRNNLGNTYRSAGQYNLAIDNYNEILDNKNLAADDPDMYTTVLDNYAYTLFLLKDYSKLPGLYLEALKICDSLNLNYNSVAINKHLAEYYQSIEKKDSALHYAYQFKAVSEKYYKDDLLNAFRILSKLESDSVATKHYEAYIKLSDSLLRNERAIRNKFGRIQYETDEIEKENVKIARERMWLLITSIVLIISSFLIYMVITQRNKNKELKFIQKQQEANEEIYNLMLNQNESIEEARVMEKKRISQELHDGVLGRLFGTRLSLDSLNMGTTPDAIKTRSQYINELKTIESDIRKVSHELNTDFVAGSGFVDIITTLVETQTAIYNLKYKINHDGTINWDEISNKNKIHIYRIVQEALHNIYKHANAKKIKVSFKLKNNVICLLIKDDGSGFDVTKTKSGIGLKNINSRIKDINGSLNISSEKQKGTTLEINIPT